MHVRDMHLHLISLLVYLCEAQRFQLRCTTLKIVCRLSKVYASVPFNIRDWCTGFVYINRKLNFRFVFFFVCLNAIHSSIGLANCDADSVILKCILFEVFSTESCMRCLNLIMNSINVYIVDAFKFPLKFQFVSSRLKEFWLWKWRLCLLNWRLNTIA